MTVAGGGIRVGAFGANGEYLPMRSEPLLAQTGRELGSLSLVPQLWLTRQLRCLNATRDIRKFNSRFAEAADRFESEVIAGLGYDDFHDHVCMVSGLPLNVVRDASAAIGSAMREAPQIVRAGQPHTSYHDWAEVPEDGAGAVWTRRGRTVAINAAGNHPGVHSLWLEALALGYGVVIRPSRREPITPHRMVSALRAAGFTGTQLQFAPSDPSISDVLLGGTDLAVTYGGDDIVAAYGSRPDVLVQGPGRSKIAVMGTVTEEVVDLIVSSVADHGGAACVNTTSVYIAEDDPERVARRIADKLDRLPTEPASTSTARLPCVNSVLAQELSRSVAEVSGNAIPVRGADQISAPLADGSVCLRPAVYLCQDAGARQARAEMPFPCVWIIPWRGRQLTHLRESLVLNIVGNISTEDIDYLLRDPTVRNLYLGHVPTHWMQFGLPHDGYLSSFLMEFKTVSRGPFRTDNTHPISDNEAAHV